MSFPGSLDPFSFIFGFLIASVFWWMVSRLRPLWKEAMSSLRVRREAAQARRASNLEDNHRRVTLRHAQAMHTAAPLFALDEVLVEPRLLAPPARVEPGSAIPADDVVGLTLPYMPAWPELAAAYNASTISMADALSGGMNVVILGQPGAGKTVALAHLASLLANRSETLGALKDCIPYLLHVADLRLPAESAKDVLDRLGEMVAEHASMLDAGRVAGFIQNSFRSGRVLLLLDGFDELTAEGQNGVSAALKLLLTEYPKIHVVTTGAPEYVDGLLALHFAPLAIAAWTTGQQASFRQRWGELWTQVEREASSQTGPERVDPLLLNTWLSTESQFLTPLELTLKMWAAYAGDALGSQVRDAIAAHIRRLSPANMPPAALESLAMQAALTSEPIFDSHQAREWVKSFELPQEGEAPAEQGALDAADDDGDKRAAKKDKRQPRSTAPATSGLLDSLISTGLVVAYPNNKMRFAHPVLAGFLAGRALSAYHTEESMLNQPDWVGKLLALRYLACYGDATAVTRTMLEWSRLPMHRPLLAAARWLRDAPRSAPWRTKVMAALADLLQSEGLPLALRGQAMAAFVVSEDPGVPALLRQLANSLSFELIRLLALGSGAVRDAKSVTTLGGVLDSPSLAARRAACLALVAIGTNEALECVARTLLSADEDLRRAAAEALANDAREGHAMLKDAVAMNDILLRRAVVYGLARVHEPWAIELLQKLRVEDDQWVVRNSASEMLDAMGGANNPHVPRPLKAPAETAWLIAFAGTQGVGISPGAPVTDLLLSALKSPKEEERRAALGFLKQKPTDGVVRAIYDAMYGDDAELREAAFVTLWEISASGYKLPHPTQFGYG